MAFFLCLYMTNKDQFGQLTPEFHVYGSIYSLERAEPSWPKHFSKDPIFQHTDNLEINFPVQQIDMDVSGHNKLTVVILSCLKMTYALLLNFQIQLFWR